MADDPRTWKPPAGYTPMDPDTWQPPPGYTSVESATGTGVTSYQPFMTEVQREGANKVLRQQGAREIPPLVDIPLYNREGRVLPAADVSAPGGFARTALWPLKFEAEGATQFGRGVAGLQRPQSGEQVAGAVSDIFRGGTTLATPFAAPSLLAHPLRAAAGLGIFSGAQAGTELLGRQLGLPEGYTRLAGDLVGLYGGTRVHSWLSDMANQDRAVADTVYRKLEAVVERLKDPALTAGERAAVKAQADALMATVRQTEGPWTIPPIFPNPNQAEREAYSYMRGQVGAAPSAAAATGSPFVRGGQWATAMTPAGAVLDVKQKARTLAAVRGHAQGLVEQALPEAPSRPFYRDFEGMADRAPAVNVPLYLDKEGGQVSGAVKVPVDLRDLKYDMQPLFDKMQLLPFSDRSTSAAYSALDVLLKANDFIPATTAEFALSQLKAEARAEKGGVSEALARTIIPKLQASIDGAVEGHIGEEGVTALQKGRAAKAKEAGAEWLTDQFKYAQAEGGFGHEKVLWNKWRDLPETSKRTMFTPKQASDLDKFFLGLRMYGENPNPSGTALVGTMVGQAAEALHGGLINPIFWLSELGLGGISALLRSDRGVKLLTEGLTVRGGSGRTKFIADRLKQVLAEGGAQAPAPRTVDIRPDLSTFERQ